GAGHPRRRAAVEHRRHRARSDREPSTARAAGPGQTVRVVFSTLVAPSRDEAVALADKYRDAATFDRAATLAWTQAQVQLHHLGVKPDEAHLFQSLAAHILYPQRTLRASADVLARHVEG